MPDDVLEMIGTAAALEQLAEESAELAQAALKMARKLRGENPTPKSRADCIANLQEEIADVELCISILPAALYDPAEVGRTMAAKHRRWNERLHDEKLWEVDIRDSKYSIIYNENTGAVEDVLWCNESAEDLKNLNIVADMARELVVYRRAGVTMFAGAKAIRDLIEHGRRTYHQRIVHGMRVNYYNIRLAKAMDLLMQAGALAMNERDALRECASRTAAERLFNSLLQ